MNISAWAIKNPVITVLMFIIVTIVGTMSYFKLGVNASPDVDFPNIIVTISQNGASPAELETEVTKKVEDALTGLEGLEHATSTVTDGVSNTVLQFKLGHPVDRALNDVRDAISKIRQTLPQDINEPAITHPNFSGEPILTYSIESKNKTIDELSYLVDNVLSRDLLTVPGVSQTKRAGGVTREIRVDLNIERMKALGLLPDSISNAIKSLNINVPSGQGKVGDREQTIRTVGSATTVEQLKNLQIPTSTGQFVSLTDLGTVDDSISEIRQIARFDGKPVVAMSIIRAQGTSDVTVANLVEKRVEKIKKTMPEISFNIIRDTVKRTRDNFQASIDALIIGAVLAIVVIFVFLRNWQSTLIGSLAIPLSILGTFSVMEYLGYTLNFMTTLGLILAIGILVDDAIVDLENIHRHIAMGKKPLQAAFDATDEIGLAVVATTFTIVAVFIPVAFMGGIPGMFFKSFALTVSASVLFSLVVARTLTPMMGAYMLPEHAEEEKVKDTKLKRIYTATLRWSVKHRFVTIFLSIIVFIASLSLVPRLPKGFFGDGDVAELVVGVSLPTGANLEDTEKAAKEVEQLFIKQPEVKHVYWSIGAASQNGMNTSGGAVNEASISVIMTPKEERKLSQDEFELKMVPALSEVAGARVAFKHFGPGGGGSKPVNLILKSNDSKSLEKASEQLLTQMRTLGELRDVTSSAAEQRPEIVIKPNFERAAEQGVSVSTIARTARIATQGDVEANLPKFNTGERQINIRVKMKDALQYNIEEIGNMPVQGKMGMVTLKSVADISLSSGPVQINRYDRSRQITISANLNGVQLGDAMPKVNILPIMKNLPEGVTSGTLGEADVMNDVFGRFITALLFAVMFVYTVLVALFGGFLHPLTIMVALPLSFGGAFMGLLIANKVLGLMALIGILMLMGIVTKNSILLVEYAMTVEEEKELDREEAIIESAVTRVKPIFMTSIAMISGMLPIALSLGAGTETKSPLAVAVIGGLVTSTFFTLLVIPAVYTIVDDIRLFFMKRLFKKAYAEHQEKHRLRKESALKKEAELSKVGS